MATERQHIVITGGTGLVGSRLVPLLKDKYEVHILTRSKRTKADGVNYIQWDINAETIEVEKLPNTYAVINLVGAGIADKRWSPKRKQEIIDSRVKATQFLRNIYSMNPPTIYIGASAIGYYGNRGDEVLTADSPPASEGFLSECCTLWEAASHEFESMVDHHYIARIGIVLSNNGGALPKMALPVKLGAAGYFGNGKAYYSWIHIDDLCQMITYLITKTPESRVYNGVSPQPIRLKGLVRTIKEVHRPWALLMPIPAFFLRLVMGEMTTMLTNSDRVYPKHIEASGFRFRYNGLQEALQHLKDNPEV